MDEQTVQANQNPQKKKSKKRFLIVLLFTAIVGVIAYIALRGSYLETLEIGEQFIDSFWRNVNYMTITCIINFFIIYLVLYLTNKQIKKGLEEFFKQENKPMPKLLNKSIAFIIAILVSAFTSHFIMQKAVLCFNAASFEMVDPIFHLDIGYFVFIEPFIELVFWYAMALVIGITIYTAFYYIISFNLFFDGIDRNLLKNSKFIKQMITNLMIFTVILAGFIFLKAQDIETERFMSLKDETSTYSLYGAGFSDVTIKLWGYRILAIVLVVSVYLGIRFFKAGKTRKLILCVAAVPTYLVGLVIVMIGFNIIFIGNNKFDKEKEFIHHNIQFTKNAYGVDIEEISLENSTAITSKDIELNQEVINNVAIVSKDLVLKDLKNSQTAKGYYTYRNAQLQKYTLNGKTSLVYVSPREIVSSNGTYNNKTYEYTHGYGTIITSATKTNENGTLYHIQKGFANSNDVITTTQPRIYYGLETNDTVVIQTEDKKEFDYPILDSSYAENAENVYEGKAGLNLNFIDRMILAIKEGDLKLAFSGNVTDKSKILSNRNIIERAKSVMPYLMYDENPYLVITDEGKQVWVLDAYTISNDYPYSQKTTIQETSTTKLELNYIRNSVKVLIDAYDGTIQFYITDKTDPIVMAYKNIYPSVFENSEAEIPADISEHFVYPTYLYNIQSEIVARYHNVQPDVLYRGDDIWDVASHNTGRVLTKTGTEFEPYYTMVNVKNSDTAQLGLVLPYTPYGKQNLISYMVGTYDNSGEAKLTIYKYSDDSSVLGPMQLDTQIEQDETIAKEMDSLNVNGIKIIKDMVMVPLGDSILYVEPIYQLNINEIDALPTLKKVVVASGSKVAIGNNLKEALARLVSQYAVNIEVESTDTVQDLIAAIIKANHNLTTSNDSNDWEMIGKDIKKLQDLVTKLESAQEKENKEKNELANQISSNMVNTNHVNEITNSSTNDYTSTID